MLTRSRANANYASEHLLYMRDTDLVAQPFDPTRGEFQVNPSR